MSKEAVRAFASLAPLVSSMLVDARIPRSRGRAAPEAVVLVGQRLAFRYDHKGYVEDSAEKIAGDVGMSISKVERCLPMLQALGLWVADRHGGSRDRYGSRRIPGPELCAAAHRLGLTLSTAPQMALDLGPELSTPVRIDTDRSLHTSADRYPEELSTLVTGTLHTGDRNSPHQCGVSNKRENQRTTAPTAQPTHVATGLAKRRRDLVLKSYAQIALTRATPANFDAYVAACKRTASAMPELDEYLARFPDAAASAIASWLHGDKHSMQYQREVS